MGSKTHLESRGCLQAVLIYNLCMTGRCRSSRRGLKEKKKENKKTVGTVNETESQAERERERASTREGQPTKQTDRRSERERERGRARARARRAETLCKKQTGTSVNLRNRQSSVTTAGRPRPKRQPGSRTERKGKLGPN